MDFIGNSWDEIFKSEFDKEYFLNLSNYLDAEYAEKTVYPSRDKIFSAFNYVDYNDVKAVILGQDPYHGEGQANGMAFAVNDGIQLPPSLVNIFKEAENDIKIAMPRKGSLIGWAKQGVLLLNSVLTVRKGEAFSHSNIGWQKFTDAAIKSLNNAARPIVFILWGAGAIEKRGLIANKHHIITSPHPSPLSAHRGFFGSKPFSKTNDFLISNNLTPIDWSNIEGYEMAGYYKRGNSIKRV